MRKSTLAPLLAAGIVGLPAMAGTGPTSTYYTTSNQQLHAFDANGTQWNLGAAYSVAEFAIAVGGDVRTVDYRLGFSGGLYDLSGASQGTSYVNPGYEAYDSTTDGRYNFVVDFITKVVMATDRDYQNPTVLFTADLISPMGITYDPSNNSLWIAAFNNGQVTQHDLQGNVLSSFNTGLLVQSALALDHADGTLWLHEWEGNGGQRFLQFSKEGTFLGDFNSGVDGNWLGGEFELSSACAADVNGDGNLDVLDFVAFQLLWQDGDPAADCDANGEFNVLDFVCFQQLFQAGCG